MRFHTCPGSRKQSRKSNLRLVFDRLIVFAARVTGGLLHPGQDALESGGPWLVLLMLAAGPAGARSVPPAIVYANVPFGKQQQPASEEKRRKIAGQARRVETEGEEEQGAEPGGNGQDPVGRCRGEGPGEKKIQRAAAVQRPRGQEIKKAERQGEARRRKGASGRQKTRGHHAPSGARQGGGHLHGVGKQRAVQQQLGPHTRQV